MPAGINHPLIGYVSFCAIKFAGYSIAGRMLSKSYQCADRSALLVGGVRTLIGMAAGASYFFAWQWLPVPLHPGLFIWLAGLAPIRILEWWLLLWLFYDRPLKHFAKDWRCAAFGAVWSYVLDLPALVGFIATGGLWVC